MKNLARSLLRFGSFLFSLAVAYHPAPARSADTLTLRLGPLQQSARVSELKSYALTGELSPSLQPYRAIFTPSFREILKKRIYIDRRLARQFLAELFQEEDGEKLLTQLSRVIPDSDPKNIERTLVSTLEKSDRITLLGFLDAYPSENITLDLTALASIAVQLTKRNWESTLIGSGLIEWLPAAGEPPRTGKISPSESGELPIFKRERIFYDAIRKRAIRADIYYSSETRGPLVVMSHGFAADRRFLRYFAYHLASRGLTVVSIEHPGSNIESLFRVATNFTPDRVLPAGEFIERPRDISFVLNELTGLNRETGDLAGKFYTDRVTIIGHSFGGYTALALAGARLHPAEARAACSRLSPLERSPADWLQCSAAALPYKRLSLRDHRIDRAIVLNPLVGDLFADDLNSISIPTLLLASTGDGITPMVGHQLQPFDRLGGEKYLIVADGATHMSVTDLAYLDSAVGQSTLAREVMDDRADPLRRMITAVGYAFIQQSTPEASLYRPFLDPAYAGSFSSDSLRFRLTTRLPSPIAAALSLVSFERPAAEEESLPSLPPWWEETWESIVGSWFGPVDFRTEKLSSVVGELLRHSARDLDPWG
jgi:predicted dienelactone hydrolase